MEKAIFAPEYALVVPMCAAATKLEEAAKLIDEAGALLVCAGEGMSVESGLPDFNSQEGFWRAYPAAKRLGLAFEEFANPRWFDIDPELAWGFYGHRYNLCRGTNPHEGYSSLLRWATSKDNGYFIFTTNVDGQFQKAGFSDERIVECCGSLVHLQCAKPCCAASWPAPADLQIDVDEDQLRVRSAPPRCMSCGGIARPNVQMVDDPRWTDGRSSAEHIRFRLWLRGLTRGRLAVIELGAREEAPAVTETAEMVARAAGSPLIRISPAAGTHCAGNCLAIVGDALESLLAIDGYLRAMR